MNEVGLHRDELDTPVLWVDLDLLDQNIRKLASHFEKAGINWRPHTKGIKIPEIAQMAINAGAIGVTCAKVGEAEVMARSGITDILIANQIVTPQKMKRLANLCRRADVMVTVDNADNVDTLGEAARNAGVRIRVLVDVNSGMNRAGVAPGEAALTLSRQVHATEGLRYTGLMSWEGHVLVHEKLEDKRAAIDKSMSLLRESVKLCQDADLPVEIVSGGGSGTSDITPFEGVITEIQAGGGIFCDVAYRSWGLITQPSLFVRTTVTSRPAPDRVITDAGFKTLPAWRFWPEPLDFPAVEAVSASAEHGVITLAEENETIRIGDGVDFMVGYGDATVFLHDQLYGIRDGYVEVVWPVEGRGKLR